MQNKCGIVKKHVFRLRLWLRQKTRFFSNPVNNHEWKTIEKTIIVFIEPLRFLLSDAEVQKKKARMKNINLWLIWIYWFYSPSFAEIPYLFLWLSFMYLSRLSFVDHLPCFDIILSLTPSFAACDAPPDLSECVAMVFGFISGGRIFLMLSSTVVYDKWYFPIALWPVLHLASLQMT